MARFPRTGSVAWIGVRPARGKVMRAVDSAEAVTGSGRGRIARAAQRISATVPLACAASCGGTGSILFSRM